MISLEESQIIKQKLKKYNSFKHDLIQLSVILIFYWIIFRNFLFISKENFKLLSKNQLIFFQYLYLREDIAMLSIHELFSLSEDIPHFLENLRVIDNNPTKKSKFVILNILKKLIY